MGWTTNLGPELDLPDQFPEEWITIRGSELCVQQDNGYDCGLWVYVNSTRLVKGLSMQMGEDNFRENSRHRIQESLGTATISREV